MHPAASGYEISALEHCHLRRLAAPEDFARCAQAILEHHYLHNVTLVGEHLRQALLDRGQWRAVATWSSAAFHLRDRDHFIGWSPEQCRRRRGLLANNSRLLVLPDGFGPNLISRFMKLMLGQLSADWEQRWGHPLALVETFVLLSRKVLLACANFCRESTPGAPSKALLSLSCSPAESCFPARGLDRQGREGSRRGRRRKKAASFARLCGNLRVLGV